MIPKPPIYLNKILCLSINKFSFIHYRKQKCTSTVGDLIYQKENIEVYRTSGESHPIFCKRLIRIVNQFINDKRYLNSPSSYYFYLFYLKTGENSKLFIGCYTAGIATADYHLNTIFVWPHLQQRGYGLMIVDFSYKLCLFNGEYGNLTSYLRNNNDRCGSSKTAIFSSRFI